MLVTKRAKLFLFWVSVNTCDARTTFMHSYTVSTESALSLAIRVARFGSSSEQQPEIRPWLLVRLDVCVT